MAPEIQLESEGHVQVLVYMQKLYSQQNTRSKKSIDTANQIYCVGLGTLPVYL